MLHEMTLQIEFSCIAHGAEVSNQVNRSYSIIWVNATVKWHVNLNQRLSLRLTQLCARNCPICTTISGQPTAA